MIPRIPVDSAEAREMREDAAETDGVQPTLSPPIPAGQTPRTPEHDPRCRRGWLGEDDIGRPIPCLTCRPHLEHVHCHSCSAPWSACGAQRAARRGPCCPDCNHNPTQRHPHTDSNGDAA